MKKYLKVSFAIMRLNYLRTLNHRGEFFSGLFGSLAWGILSIVMILALTANSESVFGWSRWELLVLIGVFNIIVGSFFRAMNAENFDRMTSNIQHGDLDGILLKPVDSQFMISFLYIKLHGFFRMAVAIGFVILILNLASIPITFLSVFLFWIFAAFGYIIIYSIWFLVMTFAIWFPDVHNLNEILYNTDGLTRLPPQVLWAMRISFFLILLPYTFITSTPAKALVHKLSFIDGILTIIFALGLLFFSRKFWKFALRYYTSASG